MELLCPGVATWALDSGMPTESEGKTQAMLILWSAQRPLSPDPEPRASRPSWLCVLVRHLVSLSLSGLICEAHTVTLDYCSCKALVGHCVCVELSCSVWHLVITQQVAAISIFVVCHSHIIPEVGMIVPHFIDEGTLA